MELYLAWIHLLFLSTWLGANLFVLAIVLPAAGSLSPDGGWQARSRASQGLNTVAAISAPLVLASGCAWFLLPGFASRVPWTQWSITGIKLFLAFVMIVNHGLQAFRYAPEAVRRRRGSAAATGEMEAAWGMWVRLLAANVVLGFMVFFLGLLPV